jgi:uncharacterized protein YjbI with pentapeptide repeats
VGSGVSAKLLTRASLRSQARSGTNGAVKRADAGQFGAAEAELIEASKRVNRTWLAFLVQCVYIFIATYSITPATLFRDTAVRLPIFNADLPLKSYFIMTPILILATHAYLVVLTKGLFKKIADISRLSKSIDADAVGALISHSIVLGTLRTKYRDTHGAVAVATRLIAVITMAILPIALLLLIQLMFLAYQSAWVTWLHRGFIVVDVALSCWLIFPLGTSKIILAGRLFALVLFSAVAILSVCFAAFPGEWIYTKLENHWPHAITVRMFEGSNDPVDYINGGGTVPFPNRLILPDDPKLAVVPGAPSDGVSLSVRGRNFRKAVFDRSNLIRVDFSAADLQGASMRAARLEGSKFECAGSAIVTFRGPNGAYDSTFSAQGSYVCANLTETLLTYAQLDRSSFNGAELSGSDLRSASVIKTDFSAAQALGANFSGTVGQATRFSRAVLIAADFSGAQLFAAEFDDASLQGARFSRSFLQSANFRDSRMQAIDATRAILQGATLDRAFLHAARFTSASIQGASFKGAALSNASLLCATLSRNDFNRADLNQSVMTDQRCALTDFDIVDTYDYVGGFIPDKNYRLSSDILPTPNSNDPNDFQEYGFSPGYSDYSGAGALWELLDLEHLDDKAFSTALTRAISDLPDDLKPRVTEALERLRPGARTSAQDSADQLFRTEWAKKSSSRESHDKAMAERLEWIACVADGAPYVALGLLRAKRFDDIYEKKEVNEEEKARIFARLRRGAHGDDKSCSGTIGLGDIEAQSSRRRP